MSNEVEVPFLLSVNDAARLLGVGRTLMWKMVNEKMVSTVRLGHRVFVPRHEIERVGKGG